MAMAVFRETWETIFWVHRIDRRKSVDDLHKNAIVLSRYLQSENVAVINRSTVSRSFCDVGIYRKVGIWKHFKSKKKNSHGLDWCLTRNTKIRHVKIGKKKYFLMERNSIYSGVIACTMPYDLKTKGMIRDVLILQWSMAKGMLFYGEHFLKEILVR